MRKIWIIVILALCGLAGAARAETTLRVGKAMAEGFTFVPLDVGMQTGIFAKHGIAIEEFSFGGSAKLQQGLATDAISIGLSSGPELAFVVKGAPIIGVAALAGRPLLFSVIVRQNSPVRAAPDLKGSTISVSTVNSLTQWLLAEYSAKQGWGHDGIKAPPLGADTAQIAAMKTKQTDGMVIDLASAYRLEESGDARIVARLGDVVQDFHSHVIYARRDLVAKDPDAVRRFLAGWFETIALMRADRTRTVAIVHGVLNQTPEITGKLYDEVMPMFSADGRFQPAAMATLQRSFVEMGILPVAPDMAALVTEAYLPEAPGR